MDSDGYPEWETVERIRKWETSDTQGLMEFIASEWWYPDAIHEYEGHPGVWRVATGGWSGNEELIGAMRENQVWWALSWMASHRGGLFVFAPMTWRGSISLVINED